MALFDPYGTLAAAMTGIEVQEKMSRGSGRTQTMIAAACDTGGTIVCTRSAYDHIMNRIPRINRRSDRVKVIPVDPTRPEDIYRAVRHGPVYFDHQFIMEAFEYQVAATSQIFFNVVHRFPSPDYRHDDGWKTRVYPPIQFQP